MAYGLQGNNVNACLTVKASRTCFKRDTQWLHFGTTNCINVSIIPPWTKNNLQNCHDIHAHGDSMYHNGIHDFCVNLFPVVQIM